MIILSEDYFSVDVKKIKEPTSHLAILDGKAVYETAAFAKFAPPSLPILPEFRKFLRRLSK